MRACRAIAAATSRQSSSRELRPLGDEHDGVGAARRASSAPSANSTPVHQLARLVLGDRVVGDDRARPSACSRAASTSEVASRMSSVFGLKARPSSAIALADERAEVLLELADHAALLQLVDLDDRVEQLEVVAGVAGELLERVDVLGEARAAEADARPAGTSGRCGRRGPCPRATSTTSAPVSSQTLAISLMKRDLRGEERVGGELDHLGAGDVGAHERRVERRVELDDRVAGPVAVVADDDAVGLQEVRDRRALLEELGARDVAEALLALLARRCA